jgi:hypothetical protein
MKKLFIALALFTTTNLFSQTITNPVGPRVVIDTTVSIGYDIDKFGAEYAQEMSTWSNERIEWFNQTFCHKRGHIRIPDKPIQPYVKQD